MKEFKSLLEDAEKLISYDAEDQEARQGTSSWKTLAGKLWFTSHRKNHVPQCFRNKDDPNSGSTMIIMIHTYSSSNLRRISGALSAAVG